MLSTIMIGSVIGLSWEIGSSGDRGFSRQSHSFNTAKLWFVTENGCFLSHLLVRHYPLFGCKVV